MADGTFVWLEVAFDAQTYRNAPDGAHLTIAGVDTGSGAFDLSDPTTPILAGKLEIVGIVVPNGGADPTGVIAEAVEAGINV